MFSNHIPIFIDFYSNNKNPQLNRLAQHSCLLSYCEYERDKGNQLKPHTKQNSIGKKPAIQNVSIMIQEIVAVAGMDVSILI